MVAHMFYCSCKEHAYTRGYLQGEKRTKMTQVGISDLIRKSWMLFISCDFSSVVVSHAIHLVILFRQKDAEDWASG